MAEDIKVARKLKAEARAKALHGAFRSAGLVVGLTICRAYVSCLGARAIDRLTRRSEDSSDEDYRLERLQELARMD